MLPILTQRAPFAAFDVPCEPILAGAALRKVKALEASILDFGLLCPVVVARSRDGCLVPVDGRARLLVIKRLMFQGRLPRSLATVPYVLADTPQAFAPLASSPLSLLSNLEQYEQVRDLSVKGLDCAAIAQTLYAPREMVDDLLSVDRLSPRLRNAFFGGHVDLAQARAFATLPNPASQDALLVALGPFAKGPDILAAIAAGETVVDLGGDDTLILPSRTPGTRLAVAA